MDSTKRDLIDKILFLAETEPTIMLLVEEYADKHKRSQRDVIQSHINDIVIDIIYKQIKLRKETESMMKMLLSKEECILNIY